jgi:repressor LexA
MLSLNDRQQAILAFIQEHIASKGYAPSVRDIHALGLCALHTLTRDLVRLTEAGAIQRDPGVARGIRLPEAADQKTGQLRALVAAWETLRPDMDIARSQAAANMDRQVGLARELLHERRDHAYR